MKFFIFTLRVMCSRQAEIHSLTQSLLLGLVAGFLTACGDSAIPDAPSTTPGPLTETYETADITFHFGFGDSVNELWQQAFHEWATNLLGVSPHSKLHYYKYKNEAEVRKFSGRDYRSWADISTFSIHTPDPQHGHEAIHLYTSLIGWPSDYFLEGLAVGLNLDPFTGAGPFYVNITDENAHALSQTALLRGSLIPIESIVESDRFWTRPETETYPQAGSFINFIFQEYGVDKLRALTSGINHSDSTGTIMIVFETIYGFSLSEAELRWQEFLRQWQFSQEDLMIHRASHSNCTQLSINKSGRPWPATLTMVIDSHLAFDAERQAYQFQFE